MDEWALHPVRELNEQVEIENLETILKKIFVADPLILNVANL